MSCHEGLRVLLTIDSVGGVWQYGLDLAQALGEHGVEVLLAHIGPGPSEEQRREVQAIPAGRLIETGLPLDWLSDGPQPVLAAGKRIAELARDLNVGLIHYNTPSLAASACPLVPVVAVAHGCVSTWWQAARPDRPLDAGFRWHHELTGEGLRAVDAVVAPTAAFGRTVAERYNLRSLPRVVHNGRTSLVRQLEPERLRPQNRVLTVGRLWDRVKRTALLDRVAGRLSVPFHAAGALTAPHGERAAIRYLQPLGQLETPALGRHLAERPVFVSAASFEPFGLAVLEAAQAGCALVLSDIASFRELWDGAALFVTGEDEFDWAKAVEHLLYDPEQRLALGEAARVRAGRYTPPAMAAAMLDIYAGVLDPATRRAAA